jgi:halocyanin-like protein
MGPHHSSSGHHGPSGHHDQMGPHHGRGTADSGTAGTLADWFANVDNYTEVVDRRGLSTVTVAVGAAGNGGVFAYDPPAIRIDQGATVTWEWTGEGGSHDVVAVDETFASASGSSTRSPTNWTSTSRRSGQRPTTTTNTRN